MTKQPENMPHMTLEKFDLLIAAAREIMAGQTYCALLTMDASRSAAVTNDESLPARRGYVDLDGYEQPQPESTGRSEIILGSACIMQIIKKRPGRSSLRGKPFWSMIWMKN